MSVRPSHKIYPADVAGDEPMIPRKRVRQSCDTCRSRKTKCIIPAGSRKCQYCESVGAVCSTSTVPRKRPYYRVSEEEYELCMRLLRHFVPDTDLSLDSIKRILTEIETKNKDDPTTKTASTPNNTTSPVANNAPKQPEPRSNSPNKPQDPDDSSMMVEDTGCMIIDPSGKYRYVDADSSLRFDHAARVARQARSSQTVSSVPDPTVISPFVTGMPPATPGSMSSVKSVKDTSDISDLHLPSREICMRYVTIFFEQVHCIYWVYSPEQFYSQLEKTLQDGGTSSSPSWLCSLYSIFSIASALPANNMSEHDAKTSSYYLSLAKALSIQICEIADVESLRAIVLLSLAFHSSAISVSFYLTIGVAVRIAFSLGLHRNISPESQDWVERERCRRLWWTIYQLDQEISMQLGHPCAIVDEAVCIQTLFASEQLLDPGRNTPLEYQAVCVSLIKLKKKISQTLYVVPAQTTRRVRLQEVTSAIVNLQAWLDQMPPHLRCNLQIYPSHRRAIYTLHLRYWSTMIHVTRPFLLYSVARPSKLRHEVKRQQYEELSDTCQNAAEHAVKILRMMLEHRLLSSLLLFDVNCIQELLQVFLLVKYKGNWSPCREELELCMHAYRSMAQVGWTKRNLSEITALLSEAGILENEFRDPGNQEAEKEKGIQLFLQSYNPSYSTAFPDPSIPVQPLVDKDTIPDIDLNFDAAHIDIFDTLGLDMGFFSSMDWPGPAS